MDTTMNITNTDLRPRSDHARSAHPLHPMLLPRALFVAELLALRLTHVARDSFRGAARPSRLAELGAPLMIRSDAADDEVEAIIHLRSGEPAWIDTGHGHVRVEAAARSRDAARAAVEGLRRALESPPPAPERISIAFWMRSDCGGDVLHRQIEADSFDAIADNYSGDPAAWPVPGRHRVHRPIGRRGKRLAGRAWA
jgi:hypothetical protein